MIDPNDPIQAFATSSIRELKASASASKLNYIGMVVIVTDGDRTAITSAGIEPDYVRRFLAFLAGAEGQQIALPGAH